MSQNITIGRKEYFPGIAQIPFEGKGSDNPLAFKAYDATRVVAGKTMQEHLRFAVCYWHTFCGTGADPFGPGTRIHAWDSDSNPMQAAKDRLDAAFEFFSKLTVPYYCFHDRDLAPEGDSVSESEKNLQHIVALAKEKQKESGVKLLWGTANTFSHTRYMNGAATNPDFNVVAHAGAQVKAALDATVELGGENYVFWGGREGYACLQNTSTKTELDNFARFLTMARDYGRSIGFKGPYLIEPKPMEPMYHQYDSDAQTVIGFLRHYGLDKDFKINLEANHTTLSGHDPAHDVQMCIDAGMLGSIDANRGNPQNGWDTDQFPTNIYDCALAMSLILDDGGFTSGGLNFDAKLRRESTNMQDFFIAHIGGMDTYARGLLIAEKIVKEGKLAMIKDQRYRSFNSGEGKEFREGKLSLNNLREHAHKHGEPVLESGRQEYVENLINDYIFSI